MLCTCTPASAEPELQPQSQTGIVPSCRQGTPQLAHGSLLCQVAAQLLHIRVKAADQLHAAQARHVCCQQGRTQLPGQLRAGAFGQNLKQRSVGVAVQLITGQLAVQVQFAEFRQRSCAAAALPLHLCPVSRQDQLLQGCEAQQRRGQRPAAAAGQL